MRRGWANTLTQRVNIRAHETNRKRQSTRMMKAECVTEGCGFKVRISRTWAAQATPLCPCCEGLASTAHGGPSMTEGPDLCRLAGQDVRADGDNRRGGSAGSRHAAGSA